MHFLVYLHHTVSLSGVKKCIVSWTLQEVSNPILKEILSSGSISITSCILVYCVITPLLEEIVYRGVFLTALSSTMKWQEAVIISSIVFSAAHFSVENFIQLFIIGLILACSYCWSGNLKSCIVIHSLYNALTLLITYTSWIVDDEYLFLNCYFSVIVHSFSQNFGYAYELTPNYYYVGEHGNNMIMLKGSIAVIEHLPGEIWLKRSHYSLKFKILLRNLSTLLMRWSCQWNILEERRPTSHPLLQETLLFKEKNSPTLFSTH